MVLSEEVSISKEHTGFPKQEKGVRCILPTD